MHTIKGYDHSYSCNTKPDDGVDGDKSVNNCKHLIYSVIQQFVEIQHGLHVREWPTIWLKMLAGFFE